MAFEDYERSSSLESTVRTALTGAQAGIWTALPGIVQSFDASAVTAVVRTRHQGDGDQTGRRKAGRQIASVTGLSGRISTRGRLYADFSGQGG